MTLKNNFKYPLVVFTALLVTGLVAGGYYFLSLDKAGSTVIKSLAKPSEESFQAPGRDWPSEKKVEDYFVEHLRMTPQEALEIRFKSGVDDKVMLRLRENTTLEALLSNLEFYGLVRDKAALRYALEHSEDTVPGHTQQLKVGNNTIDTWAYYKISENMTAWEIADQLVNHPTYFSFDEYNYMFMP